MSTHRLETKTSSKLQIRTDHPESPLYSPSSRSSPFLVGRERSDEASPTSQSSPAMRSSTESSGSPKVDSFRQRGNLGSSSSPGGSATRDWRKRAASFRPDNRTTSREIMRRAASGLGEFISSSPKMLESGFEERGEDDEFGNGKDEETAFLDSTSMYVRIDELLDLLPAPQVSERDTQLLQLQAASFRHSVKPRRFKARDEIVGHGHDSASLFFITAGQCQVMHDKHSAILGPGTFFGEESIIKAWLLSLCPPSKLSTSFFQQEADENPLLGWHSNLVRALTDSTVMEIPASKAFPILRHNAMAWSLLLAVSAARNEINAIPIPVF